MPRKRRCFWYPKARSRRVQAQRKFAQGAYVPPNVAAAAPADNRRDAAQDPSNVTRNHMTASNLLDVVSLQSASSSPERRGVHYHLTTSQPVVLLERLRARQQVRDASPLPSSSRDSSQPASDRHDESYHPSPVLGPTLRTAKKTKEFKRVHAMSLRSRRLSALHLNKLIAESCALPRKSFKRKVHSSDEDEPLIFQKNKNKKTTPRHSLKRTATREAAKGLVSIVTDQSDLKVAIGTVKQNAPKKQSAHLATTLKQSAPNVCAPVNSSPKRSPKKKRPNKCTQEQPSLKKQQPKKNTIVQSSPNTFIKTKQLKKRIAEKISQKKTQIKKQAKKSTTIANKKSVETTPQKIPELLVTVDVKSEEELPDAISDIAADSDINRDTTDQWVIPVIPDDPLATDSPVTLGVVGAADDLDMPVTPGPTDYPVLPTRQGIPTIIDEDEDITLHFDENAQELLIPTSSRVVDIYKKVDNFAQYLGDISEQLEVSAIPSGPVVTNATCLEDSLTNMPEIRLESPAIPPEPVVTNTTSLEESLANIPELRLVSPAKPSEPIVTNATSLEDSLEIRLKYPAVPSRPVVTNARSLEDSLANMPELRLVSPAKPSEPVVTNARSLEDSFTNMPEIPSESPAVLPEPVITNATSLEDSFTNVPRLQPIITSVTTLEDALASMPEMRLVSPEPGPSGMQYQFSEYDSDNDEQVGIDSETKIYLGEPDINEEEISYQTREPHINQEYYREALRKTVLNLELRRTRNLQKKTCVAASLHTEQDVMNASQQLLDSRCKMCRPCIRIKKLMKVWALFKGKKPRTENQNNGPGINENDHNEIETSPPANAEKSIVYLEVIPKDSNLLLKIGGNEQHGKLFLSAYLVHKNEVRESRKLFNLEEYEYVMDNLLKTLTASGHDGFVPTELLPIDATIRQSIQEDGKVIISSDSDESDGSPLVKDKSNIAVRHYEMMAVKRRVEKAIRMQDHIRKEKEKIIAEIEEQKRKEISRIMAEKNMCEAEISRYQERFTAMQKEKEREFARLKMELRVKLRAEMEADRSMIAEVDGMAKALENEKDAKSLEDVVDDDLNQPGTSGMNPMEDGGVVDAPVYHPTMEEFEDPLIFYEKIWDEAVQFGICKIVPPPGWQPPPAKLNDEMRFDVTNQYISRMFSRWGPAARELCAIKLCLQQQKIVVTRWPCLDGVEVNLPKLYHLVQRHGGLETVINKKKWGKVAEDMKFTRGPLTERRLDQIYVKFLLPYDTLSHQERQEIMMKVEVAWHRKNQKLLDRAMNPLYRQKRMLGLQDDSEDETDDPETVVALKESEDCITKGAVTTLAKFKKVATMTYENKFGQGSEAGPAPNVKEVEEEYWRHVTHGAEHTCVHSAAIDTGDEGYGFTKNETEDYGTHPWNPKMVSKNARNVLSYLDEIIGLTVPTLLLGMLYATSCWHKDPHQISWLEYQHQGPPRVWYAVPERQTQPFRKAVEILCPGYVQNKTLWLPTDITMIPPEMLREHNVTLTRVEQKPGEFIMAFPNAYTCCISTGFTVSESVYFAPPSWLTRLWTVFRETRESCEPTMFAMEHLLYNIARDETADPEIATTAQPLFDSMLREEVTNRQMLQERGLSFVQELYSAEATPSTSSGKKKPEPARKTYIPRDQEECEYCRATLYLSKVKGLTDRNTFLCLEHALKFLESHKYKDADVSQVQVLVHVSVKELNTVNDNMKRRLGKQ